MLLTDKKTTNLPILGGILSRPALFEWTLVIGLTALAFFMRRKGLATQSLWFDEADLLARAQRAIPTLLGDFLKPGENGPLYTFLIHFWVQIAGTGEAALRTPSLLAGTAVVPLVYALGKRYLGGSAVGLIAAGLIAVSPYQLWYSQDAKMYPLALLMTLASVYLFLAALERGGRGWWAAYVILTTLSFYIHLMSVLIVAVEVFYYFLTRPRPRKLFRDLHPSALIPHPLPLIQRRALISLGLLTLPYLPIAIWQLIAVWDGGLGKTWFRPVGLFEMLNTLGRRFGVNRIEDPLWETAGAIFYATLALLGLFAIWKWSLDRNQKADIRDQKLEIRNQKSEISPSQTNAAPHPSSHRGQKPTPTTYPSSLIPPSPSSFIPHPSSLLLSLYLGLPIVAFYALSTRIPLFADRYLLIASPAYYLLIAWGLVWLTRKVWPVAVLSGMIALMFAGVALFSFNYAEAPQKEDWREGMRWLQSQLRPGDEVIVLPGYLKSAVDYYLKPGEISVQTVPQNLLDGHDDPALVAALSEIVRGHERAWLVVSPERYRSDDPQEYVRKVWFDNNTWMFSDPKVFVGVTIYGYTNKQIPGTNADFYPRNRNFRTNLNFGSSLMLEGYDLIPDPSTQLAPDEVQYDANLHLTLYWRKLTADPTDYRIQVRLLDAAGNDTKTNYSAAPLNGYYPTGQWKTGEAVRDYRELYIRVAPGQYRLEISVFPAGQPQQKLLVSGSQGDQKVEKVPAVQLNGPITVGKKP